MRSSYTRYRTVAEPNFVAAPASTPANSRGNAIIVRLIWLIIFIVLGVLVYRHWQANRALEATVVPAVDAPAAVPSAATPKAVHAPVSSAGQPVQPCVAVNDECGNVTPVGVRVGEGTADYHTDADGRVRPDAPPGWIPFPVCSDRQRVWVETNLQGDITGYHCAK